MSSKMRQNQITQQRGERKERAQVQVLFYNQPASAVSNNNAQAKLNQFSTNSVSDKRLQELRAFALEYVKQIVAKASELSQGRQEAKNAQKIALFYTGANINSAASKGEIREAAVQINKQFQLGANEAVVTRQPDALGAKPFTQTTQVKHHVHINHSVQQLDELDQSSIVGQALEAGLSSSSTSSFANASAANSNKKAKKSPEQVNCKEEKRKLYDRLNWHLLVSCFSTCLPQTMADTIPSGGSRSCAGSRGGAPL